MNRPSFSQKSSFEIGKYFGANRLVSNSLVYKCLHYQFDSFLVFETNCSTFRLGARFTRNDNKQKCLTGIIASDSLLAAAEVQSTECEADKTVDLKERMNPKHMREDET